MNRSRLCTFLVTPFVLACFALSPQARAVTPAPDGGYPNGNTAEGQDALFNLDTSQGINNTAIGFDALTARLEEQAAQIQKVSVQLATGRVRVAAATGLQANRRAQEQTVVSNP